MTTSDLQSLTSAFRDSNRAYEKEWATAVDEYLSQETRGVWRIFNSWAAGTLLLNVAAYYFAGVGLGISLSAILVALYGGFSLLIEQHLAAASNRQHLLVHLGHSKALLWQVYRILDDETRHHADESV